MEEITKAEYDAYIGTKLEVTSNDSPKASTVQKYYKVVS